MNTYIALDLISIIALFLLIHTDRLNSFFKNRIKKTFTIAAYITSAVLLADIGCILFDNSGADNRIFSLLSNVIGFAMTPLSAVGLSGIYFSSHIKKHWAFLVPIILNFILSLSSPWTGAIFFISPENIYSRGPLFGIFIIACICSLALVMIECFKAAKHYQCRTKTNLILLFAYILGGTSVQVFIPNMHTTLICITLSLVVYYSYFCEFIETQDSMTKLLNRHAYEQDLFRMDRRGYGTIIIFDVDDFKIVNDQHGHQWGDECLSIIGETVRRSFSHLGFCYRIGGDELCVLSKLQDEQAVEEAICAFHKKIGSIRDKHRYLPMVSVGYSLFSNSYTDISSAVQAADNRMYHFKDSRKQEASMKVRSQENKLVSDTDR